MYKSIVKMGRTAFMSGSRENPFSWPRHERAYDAFEKGMEAAYEDVIAEEFDREQAKNPRRGYSQERHDYSLETQD